MSGFKVINYYSVTCFFVEICIIARNYFHSHNTHAHIRRQRYLAAASLILCLSKMSGPEDFNCDPLSDTAYMMTQGKRIKKSYGQGRSVIHANVAEALKMRQVSI